MGSHGDGPLKPPTQTSSSMSTNWACWVALDWKAPWYWWLDIDEVNDKRNGGRWHDRLNLEPYFVKTTPGPIHARLRVGILLIYIATTWVCTNSRIVWGENHWFISVQLPVIIPLPVTLKVNIQLDFGQDEATCPACYPLPVTELLTWVPYYPQLLAL